MLYPRMIPVNSTVEKFEKLAATDDSERKTRRISGNELKPKENEDISNGVGEKKTDDVCDDIVTSQSTSSSTSPGQGEATQVIVNGCVNDAKHDAKNTQAPLESGKECNLNLGARSKTAPTLQYNSYEFSEEKYLQEVKSKPIPTVSPSRDNAASNSRCQPVPNIENSLLNGHVDHNEHDKDNGETIERDDCKTDVEEDKALMRLRREYLENQGT